MTVTPEYLVVVGKSADELSSEVQKFIGIGFEPLGNIVVATLGSHAKPHDFSKPSVEYELQFCQPMIRYPEERRPVRK